MPNAKNRSRRLRKKLHVDEFQEFGFEVAIRFEDSVDTEEAVVAIVDHWLVDAMDKNGLMFGGASTHSPGSLGGFISKSDRGTLTEEHRALIKDWLTAQDNVKNFKIGPLVDAHYPPEEE